ncbi:hypothetical protein FB45DRAFT_1082823 [Roridomyces roridus]|uniref:Uncharacterized protein n=1 Tax=Roridomyces roridus TaxID=1738132 RepID=A0AAD7FMP9_9AGAR|nr:hypothetical protein FB45DRAFT_1082823 [Roridomyces roridus]
MFLKIPELNKASGPANASYTFAVLHTASSLSAHSSILGPLGIPSSIPTGMDDEPRFDASGSRQNLASHYAAHNAGAFFPGAQHLVIQGGALTSNIHVHQATLPASDLEEYPTLLGIGTGRRVLPARVRVRVANLGTRDPRVSRQAGKCAVSTPSMGFSNSLNCRNLGHQPAGNPYPYPRCDTTKGGYKSHQGDMPTGSDVKGSAWAVRPDQAEPGLHQAGPGLMKGLRGPRARASRISGPAEPAKPGPGCRY